MCVRHSAARLTRCWWARHRATIVSEPSDKPWGSIDSASNLDLRSGIFLSTRVRLGSAEKHCARQAHPTRQWEAGNGTVKNSLHNLVYFGFLRRWAGDVLLGPVE